MSEIDEIVQTLLPYWRIWSQHIPPKLRTKAAAREFARQKMPDESQTVRNMVADGLIQQG